MKKTAALLAFFITVFPAFAQRLATVGILPFEARGAGVRAEDAAEVTRLVIAELGSWGTITVLGDDSAKNAEYLVRGQVSRQNNQIVITAATSEAGSGRVLNTAGERGAALGGISIVSLCAKIVENVPYPNYLLGKWRSTVTMPDGTLACVMEFRPDRTIRVERYDTWEHRGTDSLKYQAIGRGNYSYAGYLRRAVTIERREISSDATVGIYLTLEDALPKYASISAGGLRLLFNDSKTGFELVYGAMPCGDNYSGPRIYPSGRVFYTQFTKIE